MGQLWRGYRLHGFDGLLMGIIPRCSSVVPTGDDMFMAIVNRRPPTARPRGGAPDRRVSDRSVATTSCRASREFGPRPRGSLRGRRGGGAREMKVCPTCGTENEQGSDFCVSCGDFLDSDSSSGPVVSDRRRRPFRHADPTVAPPTSTGAPPPRSHAAVAAERAPQSRFAGKPKPAAQPKPAEAAAEAEARAQAEAEAKQAQAEAEAKAASRSQSRSRKPKPKRRPKAERRTRQVEAETKARRTSRSRRRKQQTEAEPRHANRPSGCGGWWLRARRCRCHHPQLRRVPSATPPATTSLRPPALRPPPLRQRPRGIAPAPPAGRARPPADTTKNSLATVITIAERGGRTDLSSRLRASREGIRRTGVTVAIVGEFKKGKSNLINALVNADVCAVRSGVRDRRADRGGPCRRS